MRSNTFLLLLGGCIGAGLVLTDMNARAAINCNVYCHNYTHFCDGGYGTDDCVRFMDPQGEIVHSPSSHGSSRKPKGNFIGVRVYEWGAGLCDSGGSYGLYYEVCACTGTWTAYPNVENFLCEYGSSS